MNFTTRLYLVRPSFFFLMNVLSWSLNFNEPRVFPKRSFSRKQEKVQRFEINFIAQAPFGVIYELVYSTKIRNKLRIHLEAQVNVSKFDQVFIRF